MGLPHRTFVSKSLTFALYAGLLCSILFIGLAFFLPRVHAAAGSIQISPSSGPAGTDVTITLQGWTDYTYIPSDISIGRVGRDIYLTLLWSETSPALNTYIENWRERSDLHYITSFQVDGNGSKTLTTYAPTLPDGYRGSVYYCVAHENPNAGGTAALYGIMTSAQFTPSVRRAPNLLAPGETATAVGVGATVAAGTLAAGQRFISSKASKEEAELKERLRKRRDELERNKGKKSIGQELWAEKDKKDAWIEEQLKRLQEEEKRKLNEALTMDRMEEYLKRGHPPAPGGTDSAEATKVTNSPEELTPREEALLNEYLNLLDPTRFGEGMGNIKVILEQWEEDQKNGVPITADRLSKDLIQILVQGGADVSRAVDIIRLVKGLGDALGRTPKIASFMNKLENRLATMTGTSGNKIPGELVRFLRDNKVPKEVIRGLDKTKVKELIDCFDNTDYYSRSVQITGEHVGKVDNFLADVGAKNKHSMTEWIATEPGALGKLDPKMAEVVVAGKNYDKAVQAMHQKVLHHIKLDNPEAWQKLAGRLPNADDYLERAGDFLHSVTLKSKCAAEGKVPWDLDMFQKHFDDRFVANISQWGGNPYKEYLAAQSAVEHFNGNLARAKWYADTLRAEF